MSFSLKLYGNSDLRVEGSGPTETPSSREVVVKVRCIALNHLDLYGFRGMLFAKRMLPIVVGVEAIGVVTRLGADCTKFQEGERVAIYPGVTCGKCVSCLQGHENKCLAPSGIRGFHLDGFAQSSAVVNEDDLIRIPDGVSDASAVCAPVSFGTAEHMLVDQAKLRQRESILVHAAGSGIGVAAIQLAKDIGAKVIATVGSEEKVDKAYALGADEVINYSTHRFDRVVRSITKKAGVDVVFEHVGPDTWRGSLFSLARGGRLVTCGSTTGVEANINLFHLFNMQISILASFGCTKSNVADVLTKMSEDRIDCLIDSEFDIREFGSALQRLRDRAVFGKVLLWAD